MAKAAAKKKPAPEPVVEQPKLIEPTVLSDGTSVIRWVSEALAAKDIGPAMTHYSVAGGYIRSSNGKLTAAHPWPDDSQFLVSGQEFEKVLARMEGDDPTVTVDANAATVTVRSGRFHATISTLPSDTWAYPGVENATWQQIPYGFVDTLRSLRAFISDNPAQAWAGCVALDHGNMYATNNIGVAGCACEVGDVQALLPAYAVDFVLRREQDLEAWAHSENYVAFRWSTGAWVRSQLVIGKFPERAAALVRDAYDLKPSQSITDEFREAFADAAGLAEDTVSIYADRIESRFKRSVVTAPCQCEVPEGGVSIWGAQFLAPVIAQASAWSPAVWPKPAPFRGDNVAGFIVGRKE